MNAENKSVLIFEAHSDDCAVGMGGTTQFLHKKGYKIILVTFTTGETAYSKASDKDKIAQFRYEEGLAADKWMKIDEHIQWKEGCQAVENTREIHQRCIEAIRKYTPEIIFTHGPEDKHRDHRAISSTVTEAWWKASEGVLADRGAPHRAEKLYYFETTELFTHPSLVVDISPYYESKMAAIKEFKSQFSVMVGFEKYVEGMALTRGYHAKGSYGEAFLQSNFLPTHKF